MIDPYSTHQLVLLDVLKRTSKSILEFGAGDYSTSQIHNVCKDRKIVTVDDSKVWLDKYSKLETKNHKFVFIENEEELQTFFARDKVNWGLVFVDNGTWKSRILVINRYKNIADYIIVHDCDYFPNNGFFGEIVRNVEKRTYDKVFKYWIEFFVEDCEKGSPPTLLGSNKIDLKDIEIKGMIISNRNI
jgi:hypothetical protein